MCYGPPDHKRANYCQCAAHMELTNREANMIISINSLMFMIVVSQTEPEAQLLTLPVWQIGKWISVVNKLT